MLCSCVFYLVFVLFVAYPINNTVRYTPIMTILRHCCCCYPFNSRIAFILLLWFIVFHLFLAKCRREQLLPPLEEVRKELDRLYSAVNKIQSPVVFAHNDLLLGNILYDPSSESKVTFIDYEYADYNFQAYDIGNHFDEFAGTFSICLSLTTR